MEPPPFRFKRFRVEQHGVTHRVGTDGVLLGAWAEVKNAATILDIGTGTGIVALMLAQRTETMPAVAITAVDIHGPSAACAGRNAKASPWSGRIRVEHTKIQSFAETAPAPYDLIVSNPPFFSETLVSADETRRLGRSTRTLMPAELLEAVSRLLRPDGRFCAILPVREGRRLCELAAGMGLYCTRETAVYPRKGRPAERLLLQLERNPYPFGRSALYIYEKGEDWSDGFREMTRAFYLGF